MGFYYAANGLFVSHCPGGQNNVVTTTVLKD